MIGQAVGPDASVVWNPVGAPGHYSSLFIFERFGLA
jgi:hypothetical protein